MNQTKQLNLTVKEVKGSISDTNDAAKMVAEFRKFHELCCAVLKEQVSRAGEDKTRTLSEAMAELEPRLKHAIGRNDVLDETIRSINWEEAASWDEYYATMNTRLICGAFAERLEELANDGKLHVCLQVLRGVDTQEMAIAIGNGKEVTDIGVNVVRSGSIPAEALQILMGMLTGETRLKILKAFTVQEKAGYFEAIHEDRFRFNAEVAQVLSKYTPEGCAAIMETYRQNGKADVAADVLMAAKNGPDFVNRAWMHVASMYSKEELLLGAGEKNAPGFFLFLLNNANRADESGRTECLLRLTLPFERLVQTEEGMPIAIGIAEKLLKEKKENPGLFAEFMGQLEESTRDNVTSQMAARSIKNGRGIHGVVEIMLELCKIPDYDQAGHLLVEKLGVEQRAEAVKAMAAEPHNHGHVAEILFHAPGPYEMIAELLEGLKYSQVISILAKIGDEETGRAVMEIMKPKPQAT
ncbi:Uncharacterised protein [Candidatus Gugararchaeum adminiculabundum]|nr:Uncharacterised protein [Candidatus Gugararchaeum adminiculabundum]